MKHERLIRKAITMIVVDGDYGSKRTWYNYGKNYLYYSSEFGPKYGRHETWRNAINITEMLSKIVEYKIPLWFVKRHIKFIAKYCVWEKHFEDNYGCNEYHDMSDNNSGIFINGDRFVLSMSLPYNREVIINLQKSVVSALLGGKKLEKEFENLYVSDYNTTHHIGFYFTPLLDLWEDVRDKYLDIHGVNCKLCNSNKKYAPICSDLAPKYAITVCQSCLKSFCALHEDLHKIDLALLAS